MSSSNSSRLIVASCNWSVRQIIKDQDFFDHLEDLVSSASKSSVELLVLPELFELELITQYKNQIDSDNEMAIPKILLPYAAKLEANLVRLAMQYGLIIVAGSHLKSDQNTLENVYNACPIVFPDGKIYFQSKNILTQWEISPWNLNSKQGLIKLPMTKLGVLVCYDSEFPEAARVQAESGVELLCVPSYTESQHGYQRVNFCCRARAIENEIFVLQACLVGDIDCFGLGKGYGKSLIMTPSKAPFPDSAVLAETEICKEGLAISEIDFNVLQSSRNSGDARPWNDRYLSKWHKE